MISHGVDCLLRAADLMNVLYLRHGRVLLSLINWRIGLLVFCLVIRLLLVCLVLVAELLMHLCDILDC